MKDAHCDSCKGMIIPYADMRTNQCHCEKCGKGFSIQEFWKLYLLEYSENKQDNSTKTT